VGKSGTVETDDSETGNDELGSTGGSSGAGINTASLDDEIVIEFENAGKWALDHYEEAYAGSNFAGEYQAIDGKYIPWKFIPIGKADKVKVKVTHGNISLDKVKFVTPTGTEFYVKDNMLTLIGARQRDGYEVFAVCNENDSTSRTLGRLKVASYPLITRHVTIVPMQTGNISKTDIETALNEIYIKYGVTWEVTIDEAFTDRSWDVDNNGLKSTGTEFYSMYTDEMRALNSAYASQRGVDDKSVYIFYFADKDEQGKLDGDMPLESRFGYIFSGNIDDDVYQTIAHELGHGAFQLKHTFSKKYNIPEKSTTNLMDYDGGETLKKYQWDVLFDPQNMVAKWSQKEEEGQYYNAKEKDYCIRLLNNIACANKQGKSIVELLHITDAFVDYAGKFDYGDFGEISVFTDFKLVKEKGSIDLSSRETPDIGSGDYAFINYYLKEYPSAKLSIRLKADKRQQLIVFLDNAPDAHFKSLVTNLPEEESSDAYSQLFRLPRCSYKHIEIDDRLKYFEWLTGEIRVNSDQEVILIDLLTHVDNRKELYDKLYERPMLLAKMMLACDGENRQLFINEISKLCDENWQSGVEPLTSVLVGKVPDKLSAEYAGYDYITYAKVSEGTNVCAVRTSIAKFTKGPFDWGQVQERLRIEDFEA
ncbi:MAG: hypothetical protein MI922_13855, partial [Bacteroidales bacterium]|nr:hypothetical protein [Bacteroidales bacterium]